MTPCEFPSAHKKPTVIIAFPKRLRQAQTGETRLDHVIHLPSPAQTPSDDS